MVLWTIRGQKNIKQYARSGIQTIKDKDNFRCFLSWLERYIGVCTTAMNGLNVLVFAAGIGNNFSC